MMIFFKNKLPFSIVVLIFLCFHSSMLWANIEKIKDAIQEFEKGHYLKSSQILTKLLETAPHNNTVLFWLGNSYFELQDHNSAGKYFHQIPSDSALFPQSQLLIDKIKNARKESTVSVINDMALDPNSNLSLEKGLELFRNEKIKPALEVFLSKLKTSPTDTDLLFLIGKCYFLLHDHGRAGKYLGRIYSNSKNYEPAQQIIKDIKKVRGEVNFYVREADIEWLGVSATIENAIDFHHQKEYEKALLVFQFLYQKSPNSNEILFWLGKTYFANLNHGQAGKFLARVKSNSEYYLQAKILLKEIKDARLKAHIALKKLHQGLISIEKAYHEYGWRVVETPEKIKQAVLNEILSEIEKQSAQTPLNYSEYTLKQIHQTIQKSIILKQDNTVLLSFPLLTNSINISWLSKLLYYGYSDFLKSDINALVIMWFNQKNEFLEIYYHKNEAAAEMAQRLWILEGYEMDPMNTTTKDVKLVSSFLESAYQ